MRLTFLGTGAADWKPVPPDCAEPRRFSSAIIDGKLLIDPGPDVPEALSTFGFDPAEIAFVINTHSHSDHFSRETLDFLTSRGAELVSFSPGETKTLGRYTVSAYPGNHATCPGTLHFIISDGAKTLFYGLDGAWLLYEEAKAIISAKPDLAVLDATIGFKPGDYRIFEHNDLNMVLELQHTLKPYVKRFCVSHMARTLHTDHKTLSDRLAAFDIVTAYDGLGIEI